ncbi:MAG: clostripain-related cysteine peptidase, partial [Blastocatellia bacterium]
YPANQYLVVIWGHGAGWDDFDDCSVMTSALDANAVRQPAPSGERLRRHGFDMDRFSLIGWDDHPQGPSGPLVATRADVRTSDFLNNAELKAALWAIAEKYDRKIDILGLDACLMSMVEVCYQVRDSVELFVGSEQTIPNSSWPYDLILDELIAAPQMTAKELAGVIVDKYVAYYEARNRAKEEDQREEVALSACDLTKSAELTEAVEGLGQALRRGLSNVMLRAVTVIARRRVQHFYIQDYIDLYHFCQLLSEACTALLERSPVSAASGMKEVLESCNAVMRAIDNKFVFKNAVTQPPAKLKNAYGISIYFPSISPCYVGLDFTRATHWEEFLYEYMSKSLHPDFVDVSHNGNVVETRVSSPMTVQRALLQNPNETTKKEKIMANVKTSDVAGKTPDDPTKIILEAVSNLKTKTPDDHTKTVLDAFAAFLRAILPSDAGAGRKPDYPSTERPIIGKTEPGREWRFEVTVKQVSEPN